MSDQKAICLKTGCQLEIGGLFYWGDLHEFNSTTWIFNAVCSESTEATQVQGRLSVSSVRVDNPCGSWERRGVFVLDQAACSVNRHLALHISASP